MARLRFALLTIAGLALAACQNADRFGAGAGGGFGGPGAGSLGGIGDGVTAAPDTPAYFSQAIGDRVLFAVDQSTLSPEARSVLEGQARWLTDNPEYSAIIEGHADEQGTREYNLALGARRASSVQEFLVSRGVAPGRLRTLTYGKERPIEICSVEACYAQNRRAVTVVAAGAGV
jgi:peptidoglycan-associated lipoprotein